jgi:hypothetical protein
MMTANSPHAGVQVDSAGNSRIMTAHLPHTARVADATRLISNKKKRNERKRVSDVLRTSFGPQLLKEWLPGLLGGL